MLRLLLVPLALLLVAIIFLDESPTQTLIGIPAAGWIVLLVVALGAFVFYSLRYWRCPGCNEGAPNARASRTPSHGLSGGAALKRLAPETGPA